MTNSTPFKAWVFVLDAAGFVTARRPFLFLHEAGDYALMVQDALVARGEHRDRVRMLRTIATTSRRCSLRSGRSAPIDDKP